MAITRIAGADPSGLLPRGIDARAALREHAAATFAESVGRVLALLNNETDRHTGWQWFHTATGVSSSPRPSDPVSCCPVDSLEAG